MGRGMSFWETYRTKERAEGLSGSDACYPVAPSDELVLKMVRDGEEAISRSNGLLGSIYPGQEFHILTGRGLGNRKPHQ